jgi:multidrug efflux pump subunit AcrB
MDRTYGAAGRMAAAFIDSRLTPLFVLASIALGALAVVALPREEEPQIIVPMVDVFVQMPGATPADVEQRVTRPLEQLLWEVPGVEYVYSTSSPGQSMVVVRFKVNEPQEAALVRLKSETGRECGSHPTRCDRAHGQAALDRRCADPGRHGVVGALRRRSAAIARRPAARGHR